MRVKPSAGAFAAVMIVGGTAMLAAPAQQTTLTPGQMTEAHVWVQNRGRKEAVPVVGPIRLRDKLVLCANAAPRKKDLEELLGFVKGLRGPASGKKTPYADAYIDNIDNLVARGK